MTGARKDEPTGGDVDEARATVPEPEAPTPPKRPGPDTAGRRYVETTGDPDEDAVVQQTRVMRTVEGDGHLVIGSPEQTGVDDKGRRTWRVQVA